MLKQTPKNKFKPPVKPLYRRTANGSPIGKPDMRNALFPLALLTFLAGLATIIILVILVRGPDTHTSLWNATRDFSRTEINYVSSLPVPKVTLLPPTTTPVPGSTPVSPTPTATVPAQVSFSQDVLPIFKASCSSCHGSGASFMGINLTSYSTIVDTKAHPQLFVPGKPDESLIMNVLRGKGVQMPPSGALPEDKIGIVEQWIRLGGQDN